MSLSKELMGGFQFRMAMRWQRVDESAFEGTPLAFALRDCGITAVTVVGVAMEIGIEPTVRHLYGDVLGASVKTPWEDPTAQSRAPTRASFGLSQVFSQSSIARHHYFFLRAEVQQ